MREETLHYLWKTRSFDFLNISTEDGASLQILNWGYYNDYAGPDFSEVVLISNGIKWIGSVEMHIKASDWNKHKHSNDSNYDNVILHVVWEYDQDIYRKDGSMIPVFKLQDYVNKDVLGSIHKLLHSSDKLPCSKYITQLNTSALNFNLSRYYIERIEEKATRFHKVFEDSEKDWNSCFYKMMLRSFGLGGNEEGMKLLSERLPYNIFQKHIHNRIQLSALVLGVSGLLEDAYNNPYSNLLKREYKFLKAKYTLLEISPKVWRYARLRPNNYPDLRLAQLVSVYHECPQLHSELINLSDPSRLRAFFQITLDPFWADHFVLKKKSIKQPKSIGDATIDRIIVNAICPLLWLYFSYTSNEPKLEKLIDLMINTKPEKNKIMKLWKNTGIGPMNAHDSQALYHLYYKYCSMKRCFECTIGHKILQTISTKLNEPESEYRA